MYMNCFDYVFVFHLFYFFSSLGAVKLWRNLTFFVAFPAIGLCMVNTYLGEKDHIKHIKEHRPEFIPYEHLRIRRKV